VFGEIIHAYTRAQAHADGTLTDASALADQLGFRHPVSIAAHAWADAVAWPHDDASQDETGRLWDVLAMARVAVLGAARRGDGASWADFDVLRVPRPDAAATPVRLRIELGPGDDAEPVFTITAAADR
jgi:hypothetical protein